MNAITRWIESPREVSSTTRRLVLTTVAVGGTAVYAASFHLAEGGDALSATAWRIGAAATVSWVAFGLLLLAIGRRATSDEWIDLCLSTMAIGIAVMSAGTLYNVFARYTFLGYAGARALRGVHFAALAAADLSMCAWFVVRAGRKGMSAWVAIAAWVFGLNATFVLLMILWS